MLTTYFTRVSATCISTKVPGLMWTKLALEIELFPQLHLTPTLGQCSSWLQVTVSWWRRHGGPRRNIKQIAVPSKRGEYTLFATQKARTAVVNSLVTFVLPVGSGHTGSPFNPHLYLASFSQSTTLSSPDPYHELVSLEPVYSVNPQSLPLRKMSLVLYIVSR